MDGEVDILISVVYTFTPESQHISEGQRFINGAVNVSAFDTGQPVDNFPMSAYLVNGTCQDRASSTHFSVVGPTNQDGLFTYEFESFTGLPSFHNQTFWGSLRVCFSTDSEYVDPINKTWLANFHGGLKASYEKQSSQAFGFTTMLGIALITILLAVGATILIRRRRKAACLLYTSPSPRDS